MQLRCARWLTWPWRSRLVRHRGAERPRLERRLRVSRKRKQTARAGGDGGQVTMRLHAASCRAQHTTATRNTPRGAYRGIYYTGSGRVLLVKRCGGNLVG